jgi:hypothetical protein
MCSGKVQFVHNEDLCLPSTYGKVQFKPVYIAIHKSCNDIKPRYHITQAVMGTRENIMINSFYYIGRSMEGDAVYMVIEYILVGVKTDRR